MLHAALIASAGRMGAAAPAFTRTSLDLTFLARPDYVAGNPWGNTASAGISGGEQLEVGSNPPGQANGILGPSLEYDVADFDGTNDNMLTENAASTYFTTTNFSGWVLANTETIGTNSTSGSRLDNDCIFGTNGTLQMGLYVRSGGGTPKAGLYIAVPGDKLVECSGTLTLNTWKLIQFRGDGTNIEIRLDDDAWATASGGTNSSLAALIRVGQNPFDNQWFDGRIGEIAFSKQRFDDTTFDDVLADIRTYYDLALT